jgi:hypothetical protein
MILILNINPKLTGHYTALGKMPTFLARQLRACLKKERGCVEDQPQHGVNSSTRREFEACCGWSRTTQPRSSIFRQALKEGRVSLKGSFRSLGQRLQKMCRVILPRHSCGIFKSIRVLRRAWRRN